MGPEGAVEVLFRKELDTAEDPEAAAEARIEEYRTQFAHPYIAAASRLHRRRHRSPYDATSPHQRARHASQQA